MTHRPVGQHSLGLRGASAPRTVIRHHRAEALSLRKLVARTSLHRLLTVLVRKYSQLHRLFDQVTDVAIHPGAVGRDYFWRDDGLLLPLLD